MKKLLSIFSTLICLFVVSQVSAQPYSQSGRPSYANQCVGRCEDPCVGQCANSYRNGQFYVGGFGGANWLNFNHSRHDIHPKMKTGYTGAASVGYKFDNGFRLEGEVAYRRNHLNGKKTFSDPSYENTKISGHVSSWTYMTNVLYDFDVVSEYVPNVVPYVGVGVGYMHVNAHVKAHNDQEHISVKGKNSGLAAQGIAGVGYQLTDTTTLAVEYRYLMGRENAKDHSVGLALRQGF